MKMKDLAKLPMWTPLAFAPPRSRRDINATQVLLIGTGWKHDYNGYQPTGKWVAIATKMWNGEWRPELVPPACIVGPWADWSESARLKRLENEKRASEERFAQDAYEKVRDALMEEIEQLDLTGIHLPFFKGGEVTLHLSTFKKLLSVYKSNKV